MPAKSKAQQSAFALALAARKGDVEPEQLIGAARQLFKDKSLSKKDLESYAKTEKKKLPKHSGRQQHRTIKRT